MEHVYHHLFLIMTTLKQNIKENTVYIMTILSLSLSYSVCSFMGENNLFQQKIDHIV